MLEATVDGLVEAAALIGLSPGDQFRQVAAYGGGEAGDFCWWLAADQAGQPVVGGHVARAVVRRGPAGDALTPESRAGTTVVA